MLLLNIMGYKNRSIEHNTEFTCNTNKNNTEIDGWYKLKMMMGNMKKNIMRNRNWIVVIPWK